MPGRGTAADHQEEKRSADHEQSMLSDGDTVGGYEVSKVIYKGIGPESGKKVQQEDAFMYAMERCTTEPVDMQEFCDYFTGVQYGKATPEELAEFRTDLVEWFYSGNWIKEEEDAEKLC